MSTASESSDDSKIRVRRAPLGHIWEATNALATGQMPEQLSGSTRRSDISVESTNSVDYSSLNPLRERLVDPDSIDRNAFGALPAGLQDIELAGVSQQVGPLFHNRLSVYPKKEKALRRI